MQTKRLVAIIVVLALAGAGLYLGFSPKSAEQTSQSSKTVVPAVTPTPVDEHAAFAIFTNGIRRDFRDKKYHERNRDVLIRNDNPETVHKHKSGITWGNFFDSLPKPMKVAKDCLTTGTGQEFCNTEKAKLKFYLNGKFVDDILSMEIKDGDRLLISFGVENETEVRKQFLEVENPEKIE